MNLPILSHPSKSRHVSWVLAAIFACAALGQSDPPLTVSEEGVLLREGRPYRAVGVNFYSAFVRRLSDPTDTSYREGFATLAEYEVPFARFSASGFHPDTMRQYLEDRDGYLALLDDVVAAAAEHGVGLIPSLFWNTSCVPDLVGESRNQWGNPDSKTMAFMRTYTSDIVARYVNSPAIWAWEFGNEFDLAVDLPNAATQRPPISVGHGTPEQRSEADDLRFDMVVTAFREFAVAVRAIDPKRPIITGNSLPRAASYHQRTQLSWVPDSREQFREQLAAFTPDPCSVISVHVYTPDHEGRFGQRMTSYDELLALCMEASRQARKPLFVGEWGARDDVEGPARDAARRDNLEMITALERQNVPLAAVWVFDLPAQESFANITAENARKYLLKAVQLANHRIKTYGEGMHKVDLTGGNFTGSVLDFVANRGRSGNGFNPLQHARYRGENLFRDDATGLYFEHIFNGAEKDAAIAMFTPNHDRHSVEQPSPATGVLRHRAEDSAWGISSELRYELNGDAVDITFQATPTRDQFPLGYVAFMWASYMNHTRERRIHFYGREGDQEGWISFGDDTAETPEGFETGTVACAGVSDLPFEPGAQTLNIVESKTKRFLLPFYYGLVDGDGEAATDDDTMAYIMMFDQREPIRFALWNFIKNAAGQPDAHSPAWDWQYVVRNPQVGQTYGYRARLLYVPFTTAEDVKAEYERWAGSLGG